MDIMSTRAKKNLSSRRSVIKRLSGFAAAATFAPFQKLQTGEETLTSRAQGAMSKLIRKIATEEAFNIPEIADGIREITRKGGDNLDLLVLRQIYDSQSNPAAAASTSVSNRDAATRGMLTKLLDVEQIRLAD